MLFNSLDFAIFLPIVFLLYWFVFNRNLKMQNLLIVVASYIFYGWWDWRFLSLIFFSSLVDYIVGLGLQNEEKEKRRKIYLIISLAVNLGLLGFFKYYNFFLENFTQAFSLLGYQFQAESLKIVLPVGISFYTFQTMSYSIDVYRKKLVPTADFISFSAYVSFFPQLVAGPIERATHLLPQFYSKRVFDYNKSVDGLRQILWGLFKKIVIADNCAQYANEIFNNYGSYDGAILVFGALFFTFQIYGDFSGYSDIAIGTARLFGFDLMQNFAFPYFSRDIAEFWRRWHISLSTWFRDYVYIPLGGSRGSYNQKIRNVFVIFLLSGFWHGANWTFIVWGALNALYFLPLLLAEKNRKHTDIVSEEKLIPSFRVIFNILITFSLTVFAWIFFRSASLHDAFYFIKTIFSEVFTKAYYVAGLNYLRWEIGLALPVLILVFIIIEWLGRKHQFAIEKILNDKMVMARWIVYYALIILIFVFGGKEQQFIYFQF